MDVLNFFFNMIRSNFSLWREFFDSFIVVDFSYENSSLGFEEEFHFIIFSANKIFYSNRFIFYILLKRNPF